MCVLLGGGNGGDFVTGDETAPFPWIRCGRRSLNMLSGRLMDPGKAVLEYLPSAFRSKSFFPAAKRLGRHAEAFDRLSAETFRLAAASGSNYFFTQRVTEEENVYGDAVAGVHHRDELKKKLVSMLASVSVVFSSFGSNCYSCDFSRGFKSFSLWLTARSCSLYVE